MDLSGRSVLVFLCTCFILPQQNFGWRGPPLVYYKRFDTERGLNLRSGIGPHRGVAIVSTNHGKAIRLDHNRRQWIDLGVLAEPCLLRPDTCGSDGGALSLWARVRCSTYSGILSSQRQENGRGIHIGCTPHGITTTINVRGGYYSKFDDDKPLREWSHIVVNYDVSAFNPTTLTEFSTYVNGRLVLRDHNRYEQETTEGDGALVIGRAYTAVDKYYTSMEVDQVVCFNDVLLPDDIDWLLRNNL